MEKKEVLSRYFGYDEFRPGQEELIDAVLLGRDALGVMPTGAGKSLCYQIPALMMKGITLVISPLISLMQDQVTALVQAGVPAAYLNSSLSPAQFREALRRLEAGRYQLVYVAPERLALPGFQELCAKLPIAFVAVDEAHCISQWGQDFRPDYLRIPEFLAALPTRPVLGAYTATATAQVKQDIVSALGLRDPVTAATGFDRPNLYFAVRRPKSKNRALLQEIERHPNQSGIVYCATRKKVEAVCEFLREEGYAAGMYHAGLEKAERMRAQEDFLHDRIQIIAATNAFGMGIDKSNVSFVIHYNMPASVRAGRDGEEADCILLYSPGDVMTQRYLIEHSEPNPNLTEDEQDAVRQMDETRLNQMRSYALDHGCLRNHLLRYFGEKRYEPRKKHCARSETRTSPTPRSLRRCGSCGSQSRASRISSPSWSFPTRRCAACARCSRRRWTSFSPSPASERRRRSGTGRHFSHASASACSNDLSISKRTVGRWLAAAGIAEMVKPAAPRDRPTASFYVLPVGRKNSFLASVPPT